MLMTKWFQRKRRQFYADRVEHFGRRLRAAQAARAGVDGAVWPHDAAYLDAVIERLSTAHRRALTKFKEAV